MALLERTRTGKVLADRTQAPAAQNGQAEPVVNRTRAGPPANQAFLLPHYAALWGPAEESSESEEKKEEVEDVVEKKKEEEEMEVEEMEVDEMEVDDMEVEGQEDDYDEDENEEEEWVPTVIIKERAKPVTVKQETGKAESEGLYDDEYEQEGNMEAERVSPCLRDSPQTQDHQAPGELGGNSRGQSSNTYDSSSPSDDDRSHLNDIRHLGLSEVGATQCSVPPKHLDPDTNDPDTTQHCPPLSPPGLCGSPVLSNDSEGDNETTLQPQEDASLLYGTNPRPPLPFRHTRLFRIRRLHPWLTIDLRPFSLDTLPDYVAISHRWGEESVSSTISCNDSLLMLKPSLVACIEKVAQFAAPDTWYWIDGVCIDQRNEEEKAQQVKMLWKLFGDAAIVIMYLGEGDYISSMAIAALRQAAWARNRTISTPNWLAIRQLLHRAWFTRLWTMQEAVLARDLLVVCGEDSVSWQDIEYVRVFVTPEVGPEHTDVPKSIDSPALAAIISLRRQRAEHGERNALYCTEILRLMFSQSCFLHVDRVYAVIGLFPPELMAKIDIRYSAEYRNNYVSTYVRFCRALVSCLGADSGPVLEVLRWIAQRAHTCPGDVPSWCPDFSRPLCDPESTE